MAKYRPILCAIWDDPDFQDYSPDAKLLFLYLCTNRRTTESGIYPITLKTIQNETCIKKETIKKLLTNGLKNVSYDFDNSFVFVHRFMNYNSGGRPERIELGIKSDNQNYQTPLWKIFIEQYPHLKSGFETKNLTTYNTNYNTNTITNTKEPLQNGCETVTKPLKKINKTKYLDCVFLNDREKQKLEEIHSYGTIPDYIAPEKVLRQAKLSLAIESWMSENDIQAAGIQCWTSVQENYGCAACLTMSMLGEKLMPCACEMDVAGVVSMYALALASRNPAAILDWNNNYGDDRDKCACTHCSNYPKSFINNPVEISNLDVLGASLGEENCFGAIKGRVAAGPMTYFRISTDDKRGKIQAYLGEAEFTDDPFDMAGGIAICRVDGLQTLMKHICKNGFEHHVAMVRSHSAAIVEEAVVTYMGWDLYHHK